MFITEQEYQQELRAIRRQVFAWVLLLALGVSLFCCTLIVAFYG